MRRPPSARRPRTPARRSGPITSAVGATGDGDAGGGPATTTTTVTDISGPTATMVTTGDIAGSSTVGAGGIDQRGFRRIGAAKIPLGGAFTLSVRRVFKRWHSNRSGRGRKWQSAPVRHRGTRTGGLPLSQGKIRGRFASRAGPGDLRRDVRARGSRAGRKQVAPSGSCAYGLLAAVPCRRRSISTRGVRGGQSR